MQSIPSPDCCTACKLCFQNYARCSGRSRRSEFWYFHLMFFLVFFGFYFVFIFVAISNSYDYEYDSYDDRRYRSNDSLLSLLSIVYFVIIIGLGIPSISVTVRRLHDTGRSGFFYLLSFIPVVGPFILLYLCCLDSEERPNEYGPSPKYIIPLNQPINTTPINPYPQQNYAQVPVSPYPPQNYDQVPVNPYPQPPMVQPVDAYPQPNPMPPQPYMAPPQGPYPQQNVYPDQGPYPQ